MKPLVSIQVPTYKQADFLQMNLESCLAQHFRPLHINVSDDANEEHCRQLVKHLGHSEFLHYYSNEKNLGAQKNYAQALHQYANGKWSINLDGDDYFIQNDFITHAVELLESNPEAVWLMGNQQETAIVQSKLPATKIAPNAFFIKGSDYFKYSPRLQHFYHGACIYHTQKAKQLNFYSHPSLITDYHSLLRLALRGSIILYTQAVFQWRQHTANTSRSLSKQGVENEISALNEIANDACSFLPQPAVNQWLSQSINRRLTNYITSPLRKKDRLRALLFVLEKSDLKKWPALVLRFLKYI